MMLTQPRRRVVATMSLTLLIFGGCATAPPRPTTSTPVKHTYPQARVEADELWESYRHKADEQRKMTNGLYVWLSAIAATIIGLGITGTSGVPITGLALGGAYSYGLATWFITPEHLAIYKAGADAMRCVIDKSRPLGSAEESARKLKEMLDRNELQDALNALVQPVSDLRAMTPPAGQEPIKNAALEGASQADDSARTTLKNARALNRNLDEAGDQLWTTVVAVRTEVDFALRRTTDPRDILAHIQQNVIGAYKGLTAFGTGMAGTSERAGARTQRALVTADRRDAEFFRRLEAVDRAVATLVARTKDLAALVDATSIAGVSEGMTQCLSAAQGNLAIPRISVSPSEVTLAPGASESVLIIGTTNPILRKIPSSAKFTTTTSLADGNTTVAIKADDDATASESVLDVKVPIAANDTVDRTITVRIVTPASAGSTGAAGTPTTAPADIDKILRDKGWTCGASKWSAGPAPGGGFQATLVCDSQAAAQQVITGHQAQTDKLKGGGNSVSAIAGKLQITAQRATNVDELITAINAALQ